MKVREPGAGPAVAVAMPACRRQDGQSPYGEWGGGEGASALGTTVRCGHGVLYLLLRDRTADVTLEIR